MINYKSQSEVISAVILVLVVTAVAIIIFNFAVSFTKERISKSDCLKAIEQIEFSNNPSFTCFDNIANPKEVRLQIRVNDNVNLEGFAVEIGGATSKSFIIKESNGDSEIRMYQSSYNAPIELPGKNEERTYVIKTDIQGSARLYPIVNEETCSSADIIEKMQSC